MCDLDGDMDPTTRGERDFFLQLVYVGLLHFCNFSALNYFVKSIIASVSAIIVLILYSPITCYMSTPILSENLVQNTVQNSTNTGLPESLSTTNFTTFNSTDGFDAPPGRSEVFVILFGETVLSILMLLGLVWMLNREFEKAYRVTFHCSRLSTKDRRQILNLKNQADWLLHNIIPKHVHESLKRYA